MSNWWKIPVSWEMCGVVKVQANTLEEALKIAKDEDGVIPIPNNGEYVDASWTVSSEDSEYIRSCFNDGQKDRENTLEYAKELITQFCAQEYGVNEPVDFSDLSCVGIAYTTITDAEVEVQVNVDLIHFTINTYIQGELYESIQYRDLEDLIDQLEVMSFDSLVSIDIDYGQTGEELLAWAEQKRKENAENA